MAGVSEGNWVRTTEDVDDGVAGRLVPAGSAGEVMWAFPDGVCVAALAPRPTDGAEVIDLEDLVEVELQPGQYEIVAGWAE